MKKIVVALTALLMLVFVAGCGTEKPKDKADEAVLAFAELYTYNGTVDAAKTGMKKADIDKVGKQVDDQLLKSFAAYHLPDADQRDLTEYYLDRMQEKMDIQAKIKTASDTAPVVELSWNSIDGNKFAKMMQTDQRIVQLGQAVQEFRDAGGDINTSQDYRDAVVNVLKSMADDMPVVQQRKTIDVKCKIAKGEDGKTYWNPENVDDFVKQLQ